MKKQSNEKYTLSLPISIQTQNHFAFSFCLENDIVLRKRISNELGLEVDKAAAGDRVSTINVFNTFTP